MFWRRIRPTSRNSLSSGQSFSMMMKKKKASLIAKLVPRRPNQCFPRRFIMGVFSSSVVLAVMTAVVFAIAAPLMRMATASGATVTGLCLGCAVPLFMAAVLDRPFDGAPSVGSPKGFVLAFVTGTLLALGFYVLTRVFLVQGG